MAIPPRSGRFEVQAEVRRNPPDLLNTYRTQTLHFKNLLDNHPESPKTRDFYDRTTHDMDWESYDRAHSAFLQKTIDHHNRHCSDEHCDASCPIGQVFDEAEGLLHKYPTLESTFEKGRTEGRPHKDIEDSPFMDSIGWEVGELNSSTGGPRLQTPFVQSREVRDKGLEPNKCIMCGGDIDGNEPSARWIRPRRTPAYIVPPNGWTRPLTGFEGIKNHDVLERRYQNWQHGAQKNWKASPTSNLLQIGSPDPHTEVVGFAGDSLEPMHVRPCLNAFRGLAGCPAGHGRSDDDFEFGTGGKGSWRPNDPTPRNPTMAERFELEGRRPSILPQWASFLKLQHDN